MELHFLESIFNGDFESNFDNPSLTVGMVKTTEKLFGLSLPKTYIEVLNYRNGGFLKHTEFPMYDCLMESNIGVPFLEGIGLGINSDAIDYVKYHPSKTSWDSILADNGFNVAVVIVRFSRTAIFLNYDETNLSNEPEVWFCYDNYPQMLYSIKLATNFEQFITQLTLPMS